MYQADPHLEYATPLTGTTIRLAHGWLGGGGGSVDATRLRAPLLRSPSMRNRSGLLTVTVRTSFHSIFWPDAWTAS